MPSINSWYIGGVKIVGKMKSVDERNVLTILNKNESQAQQLVMHWQISLKLASAATYDDLAYKANNNYSYLKIVT